MSNSFQFKQFAVNQTDVAMKVGTDGVLLGAWVDVAKVERVLDIGTGTGVIALMMAQRSEAQTIVGVDIDLQATQCAAMNFNDSPWADRLQALHTSVQEYDGGTFDLVISNPPYLPTRCSVLTALVLRLAILQASALRIWIAQCAKWLIKNMVALR